MVWWMLTNCLIECLKGMRSHGHNHFYDGHNHEQCNEWMLEHVGSTLSYMVAMSNAKVTAIFLIFSPLFMRGLNTYFVP